MFENTLKALKEIQELRALEQFIGWKEDQFFEAKGKQAYNLDQQKDRVELTKDVSAMANSTGGILIIGLATSKPDPAEKMDVVSNLDLVDFSLFSKGRLEGVIRENIYPSISSVQVESIESKETPEMGVVCIIVPPQQEEGKPFLLKHWNEGSQKNKFIAFGYAKRTLSENDPAPIHEIRNWIRRGKSEPMESMARIEGKIDSIISHRVATESEKTAPKAKLPARIQEILTEN